MSKPAEEQIEFRAGGSWVDQVFTLRQLLGPCYVFRRSMIIILLDFLKAFYSIHRSALQFGYLRYLNTAGGGVRK